MPLQLGGTVSLPLLLLIAGIGLAIAEALAPGAHFIVLGVALFVAGLIGFLVPFLGGPLALAAMVLVTGGVALYAYRELDIYGGKGQTSMSDSESLKGKTGRVVDRVTRTEGRIKLDEGGFNPYYSARSIDGEIPEGTEVMVVDPGGGNVVTVESLEMIEDDIDRELAAGRDGTSDAEADSEAETDPEREPEG